MPSFELLAGLETELGAIRGRASEALVGGDLNEAVELVDRVLLTGALKLPAASVDQLRAARKVLFGRRASRAGGSNGSR